MSTLLLVSSQSAMRRIDAKLLEATERDDIVSMTKALSHGADPLAHDEWGNSALSHAANEALLDALSLQLPHVSLTHPQERLGRVALPVWAAQEGRSDVLMLILHRRDLQQKCSAGWTPLMWAAHNGHARCVSLLLPVSNRFEADGQGRNALMLAAYSGKSACAELLVDDLCAALVDNEGLTASALAERHGHVDTARRIAAMLDEPAAQPAAASAAEPLRTRPLSSCASLAQ